MATATPFGFGTGALKDFAHAACMVGNDMDLSCVIIGKNAEWSIDRLLRSVIGQIPQYLTSEIIYVDSASTDHTVEIVRQYPVRIVQLSTMQPLCASAGRYIGASYASGESILFLDSDMELIEGWLDQALMVFQKYPDIGVISGAILDAERATESATISRCQGTYSGKLKDIQYAGNAAMFRRSVFAAAGTWNPYIISDEEPEMCLRVRHAGYRVAQIDCPISIHYTFPENRLSTLLSRRRRRLFLGYGQVMRYHLRSRLLFSYLRERGWVILPAVAAVTAAAALLMSFLSGNEMWAVGVLCVLVLALAGDAIRSRSLYRAVFHVCHRVMILEGTIRGAMLHPHAPEGYPRLERVLGDAPVAPQPVSVSFR